MHVARTTHPHVHAHARVGLLLACSSCQDSAVFHRTARQPSVPPWRLLFEAMHACNARARCRAIEKLSAGSLSSHGDGMQAGMQARRH
eukprot:2029841-Lingulodinium_polyedra.AAC.1